MHHTVYYNMFIFIFWQPAQKFYRHLLTTEPSLWFIMLAWETIMDHEICWSLNKAAKFGIHRFTDVFLAFDFDSGTSIHVE